MFVVHFIKIQLDTLVHYFEDNNHPLLWPPLWIMKLFGVWHPTINIKTKFKLVPVYITMAFFFSQYIKCCINGSLEAYRSLIQYVPFHVALVKIALFLKNHEKWREIITYISSVEREGLSNKEPEIKRIIGVYIKYSHRLTYFFWIMAFLSNLSIFNDLYHKVYDQKNASELLMFDGYVPWSPDPPGNHYNFITQTIFASIVTVFVIGWDPLIVAIMIFFAGQLKVSGIYCERAINLKSIAASHQNIVECHRFHTKLVKYQEAFNSLLSPSMFVYLIVISVNLGVCITEMVELQDDPAALISYCFYVLACLIQLLLYYWHSNEVTEESMLVSYNTFKSDWVGIDIRLQREIVILAHATRKRLVFTAGPFNEMSLTTFVSILRGSYSFFALLNETN